MDIFDVLTLIGGLSLFLFGMNIMGQALERRAGGQLRTLLGKLTTNKVAGLLTGLGITAVIQSSSATTVMVVGFVNSGLMTLKQSINVIMGANIGTTVTAWLLSLAGIDSGNIFVKLLKPTSFTPVLALIGIILYMFCKHDKKKDTGMILLGFATLMFGMESMSGAVSGLRDVAGFQNLFIMFKNPILGVAAGAILTAIIQSSSASVGILQALAVTGQVSYGAAIPIIMGQNIGTCVTAMLSSVGANKNAKRAAMVHLSFNVIGTAVWLTVFWMIKLIFKPLFLDDSASLLGIAVAHSVFNALCTILMLPLAGFLEKLVIKLVPDAMSPEIPTELDERLLTTPAIAMERCHDVAVDMAKIAVASLKEAMHSLCEYSPELAASIREKEEKTDHYEDILATYLVKLSTKQISDADREESAKLLKMIGDFERISDHAVNLLESAEEMDRKALTFTETAISELRVITSAVEEVLDLSLTAFMNHDKNAASLVEPLEEVIDQLKEQLRSRHILRLQQGKCTMDAGFVWSDLLTSLERTSDHCSNIAGCVMDMDHHDMNLHELIRDFRNESEEFVDKYKSYVKKYTLAKISC
jgi:phosphate:Na+ symporter